jgi:hypothetical protein
LPGHRRPGFRPSETRRGIGGIPVDPSDTSPSFGEIYREVSEVSQWIPPIPLRVSEAPSDTSPSFGNISRGVGGIPVLSLESLSEARKPGLCLGLSCPWKLHQRHQMFSASDLPRANFLDCIEDVCVQVHVPVAVPSRANCLRRAYAYCRTRACVDLCMRMVHGARIAWVPCPCWISPSILDIDRFSFLSKISMTQIRHEISWGILNLT